MPKLNQIIAIEKGEKTRAFERFRDIDHRVQQRSLLQGLTRTYQPRDDDGERLPPESTNVQVNAADALDDAADALTRLFDVAATKEWANTQATADVVVDGAVLLRAVPVTYLLFLERQLTDVATFIGRLPTLSAGVEWHYDETQGVWASEPVETHRTKKVPRNHVKWEPPDSSFKQPAQVEMYHEDVVAGYWTKIDYSGALPVDRVRDLQERVTKLARAVKFAREEANSTDVTDVNVGATVFDYLFNGST